MNDSYGDRGGSRHRGPGPGFGRGWSGNDIWEAMDQLKEGFEQRFGGMRMGRGDVRSAVLALLAEGPMHGYQIIHEIEERSGGMWKPSPGSIYPTLQMLADEGLIVAEEKDGKKTYSLTDAGREEAEGSDDRSAPWEMPGMKDAQRMAALPKAGAKLAQAAAQVGKAGTKEQVDEAVAVLDEARRKLYAILAED
ncbi:PadR family transcriptional regulator [Microbacterium thalassium]|uniref:DNA-binding PadR family transcriptional regulator n=1 Tax=Microbacterium thalassium TaxID=362649 RepID=A0A7X0FS70_9MICO|nr:PadR family transcriptional regulator [Microbacterium thalassium]MBB6392758.1 DNA-binding PadR family transcriptional regulator [Microbacterium thalassium]GLK23010.1 transcriptional regulator [Microbacterium thalassium]